MQRTSLPLAAPRLRPNRLPPHVWRLLTVRSLRSFSQGYLNVVVPLYLISLGMSTRDLGLLFSASFLVGAALLLPVGVYADRFGRKPFLIGFTLLIILWGLLYTESTNWMILAAIGALAGIGRGGAGEGNGQGGPFAPAEQAMLADLVPTPYRQSVFTWNSFLSAVFTGLGAVVSGFPFWFPGLHVGNFSGDRVLFVATVAIGIVSLAILWKLPEPSRDKQPNGEPHLDKAPKPRASSATEPHVLRRKHSRLPYKPMSSLSVRLALQQSAAGAANTFGLGFINSLFVVWLHDRYHVNADVIGSIFSATYVAQAVGVFVAARLVRRIGPVYTVVGTRVIASLLVVATAFAPTVLVAGILQVMRMAVATMAAPVRQSFMMGLFLPNERARASAVVGVARRIPAALSPAVSGDMMTMGALQAPLYISGIFQLMSAYLYFRYFSALDE
ncbi:MFS transporter [Alicyclobacillus tolerans]|uniref:MFS transporter n=1 Tax=Alicyclobacillus tolerans TaxID=90970 RepID=UPI001F019B2E|nr:MFS transporter [Alicyclobacillus tolerans]MCF8563141.1 MFS transporter [Alicyclobacillus tolerans]